MHVEFEPVQSLYIHWPFCPYKCHFCPFVALASHDHYMRDYHQALTREIVHYREQYTEQKPIETIFFGGGTPSTYPVELLLDMFGTLKRMFLISPTTEITLEVNPGTVNEERVKAWKDVGINRLSVGVQSLKDPVLKKLNRHQSAQDVYQLFTYIKNDFAQCSIDLILGLPEISTQEWKQLLQEIVTWPINHLSIYFLTVHEDTPLYFKVKTKSVSLPCDDELVALYYWSIQFLAEHGFEQYEISNFARDGAISRHNSVYWDRKPYKGFGLGACSFDGAIRSQNEKNLMRYMETVNEQGTAPIFSEQLTVTQVRLEKIMLGLRRAQGVKKTDMILELSQDQAVEVYDRVAWLAAHNFVYERDDYVVLTPKGLSIENEIATKLSL